MRSLLYNPTLAALDQPARDSLLRNSASRSVSKGGSLVLAGEPRPAIYLITHGVFKLVAYTDGRERPLDIASTGDLLCDVEMLLDSPARCDVIAATDSSVLAFDRDEFRRHMTVASSLQLARSSAGRLQAAREQASNTNALRVSARVAGKLMDIAEALGHQHGSEIEVELPLTQAEIGQLVGTSRESACKTMKGFERQGLLETRGRKLRIVRPDLLDRLRCGARVATPSR